MDTFLGRALTDPVTGLPNIPYFCLIQNWEERRARRRETLVRVLKVQVMSGGETVRRALMWCLCRDLRTSDLIASDGKNDFRVLLTTPDAENAEAIAARIEQFTHGLNDKHLGDGELLTLEVAMEPVTDLSGIKGPCDPCEEAEFKKFQDSTDQG